MADHLVGINAYQFGFNNPVNFNDPSGLFPGQELLANVGNLFNKAFGIVLSEVSVIGVRSSALAKALPQLAVGMGAMSAITRLAAGISTNTQAFINNPGQSTRLATEALMAAPFRTLDYLAYGMGSDLIAGGQYLANTPDRPLGETLFDLGEQGTNLAISVAVTRGIAAAPGAFQKVSSLLNVSKKAKNVSNFASYGSEAVFEERMVEQPFVQAAKGVTQAEYTFTKSAGKHLTEMVQRGENAGQLARPYMRSPLTIQEIMSTGKGTLDATFKGGMNWRVPGTFRGSQGIWELGINPKTNVIYHFNFTHP